MSDPLTPNPIYLNGFQYTHMSILMLNLGPYGLVHNS